MSYEVEFTARAEAHLSRLDWTVEQRVRSKIYEMAASAETWPHESLTGPFRGYCRLRAGNYRVFYVYDRAKRKIGVQAIGHRREIYRPR